MKDCGEKMDNKNSIENNFEALEDIISKMQSGDTTLEQSFDLYNKGLELVKSCNGQIEEIEKKIEIIKEGQAVE